MYYLSWIVGVTSDVVVTKDSKNQHQLAQSAVQRS